ncbi:MAG: hypothetical protein IJS15_11505 [Victivallales bacterium]|nr:hypothetical protein [Victivallales bacterium]
MTLFSILLLLSVLCGMAAVADDAVREFEVRPSRCNGALVADGHITMCDAIPHHSHDKVLCLEAEGAGSIQFQADVFARRAGATGVELLQIKRKASEYDPQNDISDASGKYIDYCQRASWLFRTQDRRWYALWFRIQVPFVGWWSFEYDIDGDVRGTVSLLNTVKKENQWTWVSGSSVLLSADIHTMTIRNFLNGKRLDQIVIAPEGFTPPADGAPVAATVPERLDEATVIFSKADPIGITGWSRFSVPESDGVEWHVSTDDGANFTTIKSGGDLSVFGSRPLTLKGVLHRLNFGVPRVPLPVLTYVQDKDAFRVIETETARWHFARDNGALAGIASKNSGREIQQVGLRMRMFTLTLKEPGVETLKTVSDSEARLIKCELSLNRDRLLLCWELPEYAVRLTLDLKASGVKLLWSLKIDNGNERLDVIEARLPDIQELAISADSQNDCLAWPFTAGEFIPMPAYRGRQRVTYPDHAGLPFADLHNAEEGFYFALEDTFLVSSEFCCEANDSKSAVALSITKKHRIPVGTSRTYSFATAVHRGDWHDGARLYRTWFYEHYPLNVYRPWLRNIDAWEFGSSLGYDGVRNKPKDYTAFRDDMLNAARMGLSYIQAWGSTVNGPCPAYYLPRKEKGGEELFARMMQEWRSLGGQVGHYYYANGIALYYLLSDKYFCTPWTEYPEEVRPPSYQWFLRNRVVNSKTLPLAPMEEMMEAIEQLNKEAQEDTISKNQQQESRKPLGGHLPMNWNNGEYPEFLRKWIARYVEQYHCNTAYLDTFAFINALPDFNPELNMNGEGDKPMHKIAFLKKVMAEMRGIEPEFCMLTEGVGDVFGANGLYFLLSGFSRNPAIYRYTLPDHIFFQGGCNNWGAQEENTRQAFLYGNRFDILRCPSNVYHALRLRQMLSPFMNLAVFEDNIGITCSSPKVECYALACTPEGNAFVENHGTRSILLTMSNPAAQDCTVTYRLPKEFTINAALLCEMGEEPKRVTPEIKDCVLSFKAPKSFVSAMLLIDTAKAEHSWTVYTEQMDRDTIAVQMLNLLSSELALQIDAGFARREVRIPPFSPLRADLKCPEKHSSPIVVPVTVSGNGRSVRRMSALGPGYRPPDIERQLVTVTKDTPFFQDFEHHSYSADNPQSGRRSLKLMANGKFCYARIRVALEPNTRYELEFDICKSGDCNGSKGKCFVLMCNYPEGRKRLDYLKTSADENEVPRDAQYHHVRKEFRTFNDVTEPAVYIYNSDSDNGVVYLDNLCIRRL